MRCWRSESKFCCHVPASQCLPFQHALRRIRPENLSLNGSIILRLPAIDSALMDISR